MVSVSDVSGRKHKNRCVVVTLSILRRGHHDLTPVTKRGTVVEVRVKDVDVRDFFQVSTE